MRQLGMYLEVQSVLCRGLVDVYAKRVLLHIYAKSGVEGSGVRVACNGMHDMCVACNAMHHIQCYASHAVSID